MVTGTFGFVGDFSNVYPNGTAVTNTMQYACTENHINTLLMTETAYSQLQQVSYFTELVNYTVFQKKVHPFGFHNNSVRCRPILIIFGRNVAE